MICPHCDGTGEAPDVVTLECIGCQKKVKVTYRSTAELMALCDSVRCADCKKFAAPEAEEGSGADAD